MDTAPDVVNVMHDLPLYVGYDYAGATPARYDGGDDSLAPARRQPLFLLKRSSDRYQRLDMSPHDCSPRMFEYGIELSRSDDTSFGTRYFSGVASATGGVYDKESLVFTVCLQMPYRVRMASSAVVNPTRRKQLFHRGLHLWLAHPSAIWDTSETTITANAGSAGKRAAGAGSGSVPGILRDDRDKLAREHALASSWYLTERRTATWQLKACGFEPGFFTEDETGEPNDFITYPTIGQLLTIMTAAGQEFTINTPITKVHFTNRANGVTTWITDWSDLDLR